jgi:hypothetical protein
LLELQEEEEEEEEEGFEVEKRKQTLDFASRSSELLLASTLLPRSRRARRWRHDRGRRQRWLPRRCCCSWQEPTPRGATARRAVDDAWKPTFCVQFSFCLSPSLLFPFSVSSSSGFFLFHSFFIAMAGRNAVVSFLKETYGKQTVLECIKAGGFKAFFDGSLA